MTNVVYTVALIGDKDRCEAVRTAVGAQVRAIGLAEQVSIQFRETPDVDRPSVAIAIWTQALPPQAFERFADAAAAAEALLIPVVDSTTAMPEGLPERLCRLNAVGWDTAGSRGVADLCLRELGLHESERRVFISHRRSDGLQAAAQLHTELRENGWTPFIDRFAIPSGGDVQNAIEEALEDMAFLVLLETPEAHSSQWVDREVLYATSNTMGVIVVNVAGAPLIPTAEDLPRMEISEADITRDGSQIVLGQEVVERIVDRVERDHQMALARRRRTLLLSTKASASRAGNDVQFAPSWRLRVSDADGSTCLVDHLPRIPSVSDLHRLNVAMADDEVGLLVHAAHEIPRDRDDLLSWACHYRPLELVAANAIGAYWAGER